MKTTVDIEFLNVIFYVFLGFLLMAIVIITFFYKSRKKIIEKELEKKKLEVNYQKELLRAVINTQEDERKRIAQDLHDDISSKLNIVSLNTHLLNTPNLSENELKEITNNIVTLTTKALDSSRAIAHDLMPPVLEKFGLYAAIEELSLELKTIKSVKVVFKNEIKEEIISAENQLHLFRILQELMNNSIKHGNATEISILFSKKAKTKFLLYNDNGNGFNLDDLKSKKGLGMKNIESRVGFIDGKLSFKSTIDNGIYVMINF
jgi:signal transduction histidine kinase